MARSPHTAYQDGQILLHPPRTVDGRATIYALYTDPPLGRVGMTMSEARASGRNVLKAEVPMSSVARAILEGETAGLMRILVRCRHRGIPRGIDPRIARR
jgi:pyruvate/2-oxoglutarate dehydrogenase complex dihydrolipoamide dehydrogenase (E3) component